MVTTRVSCVATLLVATPEPGPTQMASPNRNRGRSVCFFLFFVLLNFLFQKCRDPNPWPDLNGGSEPDPGLLRRFHLSYQNILLCHFFAEAVSVLGKPIIIYKLNAIWYAHKHLTKYIYKEGILCPFKMIYKTKRFFRVQLFVHKISHIQKGNEMYGGVCTYTPQLAF